MSDGERYYDEVIAPALMEVGRLCEERGIALVATVEYAPGERGSTMTLPEGAGLEMQILRMCANAGRNIDALMIGITRYCKANDIRTDSSIALTRFAPPPVSTRRGTTPASRRPLRPAV